MQDHCRYMFVLALHEWLCEHFLTSHTTTRYDPSKRSLISESPPLPPTLSPNRYLYRLGIGYLILCYCQCEGSTASTLVLRIRKYILNYGSGPSGQMNYGSSRILKFFWPTTLVHMVNFIAEVFSKKATWRGFHNRTARRLWWRGRSRLSRSGDNPWRTAQPSRKNEK